MEPRVTFIIAHHNYEQYLEGCVKSALNQTYKNIHVCIIDDCSDGEDESIIGDTPLSMVMDKIMPEDTIESIETLENMQIIKSSKITFIKLRKDKGSYQQAFARNRGMEACWDNTDIFAILDADDENYPTKIEKCVQILQRYPKEVGAVYTDTNIINVDTNRLVREYREPFDNFRLINECIVHSGCVISKYALEHVLENGLVFDEDMPPCEDYDLWIRIAEKFLIYHIPEPLVLVRVHTQNSTNTTTHEHRMSRLQKIHQKRQSRQQA